jgi:hypothetical protein
MCYDSNWKFKVNVWKIVAVRQHFQRKEYKWLRIDLENQRNVVTQSGDSP